MEEKNKIKYIIITAIATLICTLAVEEYRLFRNDEDKIEVTHEKENVEDYVEKLDSLLELTVNNTQIIVGKHNSLEQQVIEGQKLNKSLTKEAIELTKIDSLVLSPSEYDSIKLQLRTNFKLK